MKACMPIIQSLTEIENKRKQVNTCNKKQQIKKVKKKELYNLDIKIWVYAYSYGTKYKF